MSAYDHLNKCTVVAIDVRTTGLGSPNHPIHIAAVVLNKQFMPETDNFLSVYIRPRVPIPAGAALANAGCMPYVKLGVDSITALTRIMDWSKKVNNGKKLLPIFFSAGFTLPFLFREFTDDGVADVFDLYNVRDIISSVNMIQDRECETPSFSGYVLKGKTFKAICEFCGTAPLTPGDGLSNAICIAAMWRYFVKEKVSESMFDRMKEITLAAKERVQLSLDTWMSADPQRLMYPGDLREAMDNADKSKNPPSA